MTVEELFLMFRDLQKETAAQSVRLEAVEYFLKQQFPGELAGETGTTRDGDLNPIVLEYGKGPANGIIAATERDGNAAR
jgi:hypothetical protein